MINRFETYFYAYYTYFTTEMNNLKTLGQFENFVFVIMSTREIYALSLELLMGRGKNGTNLVVTCLI